MLDREIKSVACLSISLCFYRVPCSIVKDIMFSFVHSMYAEFVGVCNARRLMMCLTLSFELTFFKHNPP